MKKSKWGKWRNSIKCGKLFKNNRTAEKYNNINYKQLIKMTKENKEIILLDVRSTQEYNEGHINGAISIPLYEIELTVENKISNKSQPIIVYCKSGIRSVKAINILIKKGYINLYNLDGGLENY